MSVGENDDNPHQPHYNWPDQPVDSLVVKRGSQRNGDTIWSVESTNPAVSSVEPPVTHANRPPGTTATEPVEAELEPGVEYTVEIRILDPFQLSWTEFKLTE